MDKIDAWFKSFFRRSPSASDRKRPLTDEEAAQWVSGRVPQDQMDSWAARVAADPEAQEAIEAARRRLSELPSDAQARPSSQALCPHCGQSLTPFKSRPGRQRAAVIFWSGAAAAAFGLSFVYPAYFMQCLLAALLAGVKAIVEHRSLKTQILIYRALQDQGAPGGGAPKRGPRAGAGR